MTLTPLSSFHKFKGSVLDSFCSERLRDIEPGAVVNRSWRRGSQYCFDYFANINKAGKDNALWQGFPCILKAHLLSFLSFFMSIACEHFNVKRFQVNTNRLWKCQADQVSWRSIGWRCWSDRIHRWVQGVTVKVPTRSDKSWTKMIFLSLNCRR